MRRLGEHRPTVGILLGKEVTVMKLESWGPLIDLEREWQGFSRPTRHREGDEPYFRPSIDVRRANGELIVSAELPGIDPENDLEVTLDYGYLTIRGEKFEERSVTEEDSYVRERRYGEFVRRVPVPEGVGAEDTEAGYAKGVLTIEVRLPQGAEASEPEKIRVSPEGA